MDIISVIFRELGIGIVAYSPLGRGFFSSGAQLIQNLSNEDWRKVCISVTSRKFECKLQYISSNFNVAFVSRYCEYYMIRTPRQKLCSLFTTLIAKQIILPIVQFAWICVLVIGSALQYVVNFIRNYWSSNWDHIMFAQYDNSVCPVIFVSCTSMLKISTELHVHNSLTGWSNKAPRLAS